MHSDGLTKGSVDRKALQDVMSGHVKYMQTAQVWKPKMLQSRPALEDTPVSGVAVTDSSCVVLRL